MKRKRLALLLAVALTATSVDSTAMVASAADFTADPVVEPEESEPETTENPETEEAPETSAEEVSEDTADIEFSDNDAVGTEETTDSLEVVEENGSEASDAEVPEFTSEETSANAVSDGEGTSVVPDEGITEMTADGVYPVNITEENQYAWFSFTPEETGGYEFYSTGNCDTVGYFFDSKDYAGSLEDYRGDGTHYNDDYNGDSNFRFEKNLEAGTTYYYCAKLYAEAGTGTFDVTLTKKKSVVPDEGIAEIGVDEISTVNIENADDCAWFSFTPQDDGKYSFYSMGNYDTEGYFFDSREYYDGLGNYKRNDNYYDDDSGADTNFKFSKRLNAGTTYYFCAKMLSEDRTGSFDVKLEKEKEIRSITATLDNDKVVAGIYAPLRAEVQYTFTDGSTETARLAAGGNWKSDSDSFDAGSTDIKIVSSENSDAQYDRYASLPVGTYKVTFGFDGVTSDALEFQAVDIEESPAFYGSLYEGDNPDTKTPENDYAYYKFVPAATGEYNFRNANYLYKYVKNEEGFLEQYYDNKLTAGTTYYIQLWGKVWNGDEVVEYCNLNIQRRLMVTGISFTPAKTEIYDRNAIQDSDRWIMGAVSVTYEDGSTWKNEYADCTYGADDEYSNSIRTVIEKEDGTSVDDNGSLDAGTYKVYLQYAYEDIVVKSEPFTLTVKEFSIENCPQLTTGTQKITAGIWYVLKPETTGLYDVKCSRCAQDWRYVNEDGEVEEFYPYDDDGYTGTMLQGGRIYLLKFNKASDSKETEYDCTVTRIPSPVKLTVTSREPSSEIVTFVKGVESGDFRNLKAEVEFEDGSKSIVTDYNEDEYGRYLHYAFCKKNEDGTYEDLLYEDAAEGDYVYRVYYGRYGDRVYAQDIPVKVISIENAEKTDITTGTQNIQNEDGKFILNFRPEESGRYAISFNVPISDVRMYDADGNYIRAYDKDGNYAGVEREGYAIYTTLVKDTTYYIRVEADKKYKDLKMTTSLLTRPQSMKAKAHKTAYIAGVEDFDADTMETEITYPDNTTRKVRNQEETNGYYLQYKAVKDDKVVYNGSSLTSGEWKVTPYLSANVATGTAVALDIPSEGTTITAEKPDLSKYPVIAENEEIAVSATGRTIYAFRAEQDGNYEFEFESGSGEIIFYRDSTEALLAEGAGIELREGEICAVIVNRRMGFSELKFKVKKRTTQDPGEDPGENPITGDSLALSPGMKSLVKLESNGTMDCTFTPEETGNYVIWSECNKNIDVDPAVDLYDSDDKWLENNDDDSGWNFRLVYRLEGGKTYHYKVRVRSEASSFYVGFDKFQTKAIKNIELQAKEGKDPSEFSIFDDGFEEYFERKITYIDDSVQILDWNESRDAYANNISEDIKTDNSVEDSEMTYTIQFSYLIWGEADYKEIPQKYTVKRKGFAGLSQITDGKTQELEKDENGFVQSRFVFQAPEDGEYMVNLTGQEEETAKAEIYRYRRAYGFAVYLYSMDKAYEAEGNYSFQLTKGQWYVLDAGAVPAEDQKVSVTINRTKDIRTLELVKAPEQTTMLPNDVNAISLRGMEVRAAYTDGSTETITYGNTDSSGRYLQHNGVKWINAEKCRVYVRLGRYQVSFDVNAASWDDVRTLKVNQKTELTASKGDMLTLKLNATADDLYTFAVDGGYVKDIAEAETGKTIDLDYGRVAELQKDTLYYIHIHASAESLTVNVKQGECDWKETSRRNATCTADGSITETCSVHGETRTEILPKLGHDAGEWKTTKNATCTANGEKARFCTRCNAKIDTQVIAKLGHKLGSRQTTKAATCAAAGESARICSRCKGKFEKQTIKATGKHKYGSWRTTKAATALSEGLRERTCTVCKKAKQTQKIAKLKATLVLSVAAKRDLPLKVNRSYKVNVQMTKGDSVLYWKSSDPRVVTVDKYGKITGKQAGKSAKIAVKLRSGLSTWFNVKVQRTDVATTAIRLKNASNGQYMPGSVTMRRGQKVRVTPVIAPVTGTQGVVYATSNRNVAIIDSKGQITAKAKGTAYITAKSGSKYVRIKIVVNK